MITIRGYIQTKGLDQNGVKLMKLAGWLGGDGVIYERREYFEKLNKLKGYGYIEDCIDELNRYFFTHIIPITRSAWLRKDEWGKFLQIGDTVYAFEKILYKPEVESKVSRIIEKLNFEDMNIWWYGNVEIGIYGILMRWE